MKRFEVYAPHLERVSRSFSFCIARLEGDFRDQVGLSYLILRVLDTIEDAIWLDSEAQKKSFQTFNSLIDLARQEDEDREDVREDVRLAEFKKKLDESWSPWSESFPSSLNSAEKNLIQDSRVLFEDLLKTEVRARRAIARSILNMSRGMSFFQEESGRQKNSGLARIRMSHLSELNGYCFFVAGVVGELLTELLTMQSREFAGTTKVYMHGIQFGLFLQKINILKDQLNDEKEGRVFVQSRSELLQSLRDDLSGAFEYLRAIPKSQIGYRIFCGWSLFIGLQSLPWIQKSWALKILEKIPRTLTQSLLVDIEKIILDDEALAAKYLALRNSISWEKAQDSKSLRSMSPSKTPASAAWISEEVFFKLYQGPLQVEQLSLLNILPSAKA